MNPDTSGREEANVAMQITLQAPCDRCGKDNGELHPWRFAEAVTYRGKRIEHPWLCVTCYLWEKERLGKHAARDGGA